MILSKKVDVVVCPLDETGSGSGRFDSKKDGLSGIELVSTEQPVSTETTGGSSPS